ncbi:MAG: HEAT repeat domain-containing protein [Chloroflexi bacterium]|nr:HEAT repeat domain-containing protein [Chloroflexota bacterium]
MPHLAALVGDVPLLGPRIVIARLVYAALGIASPQSWQFGDERVDVRVAAAEALGQLGGERAAGALVKALGDESPQVRTAAARALAQTDVSPDEIAIARALAQVAGAASGQEIRLLALRVLGEQARGVVDRAIREATRRFTRALGSGDPDARLEAVAGLYRLRIRPSPTVVDWLLVNLDAPDPLLRVEVAKLLTLGEPEARQRLLQRLREHLSAEDWQTRRTALIGLRELAMPEAFDDLEDSYEREEFAPLRELALVGAMATGVEAARGLARRAFEYDHSARVRACARKLLGLD